MSRRGEVLIAILNDRLDYNMVLERHWYRIPVSSVDKWLRDCWPPEWLAVYCASGKLDLETDGDTWHANPEKAALDMVRDNDLQTAGWTQLHFNTQQIREELADYCVPQIVKTVNGLGGLDEGRVVPRELAMNAPARQLSMFDDL